MTTAVTTTTQPTVASARRRIHIPPSLRRMLRRLTGCREPDENATSPVPAPTGLPGELPTHNTNVAESYPRGMAVWAYIAGAWLAASVTEVDGNSVLVTYRVPGKAETSLEIVHRSHLAFRGGTPKAKEEASVSPDMDAGQARATLLVHHADEHGMCRGCADLAHFCWAPCPTAREAMRILDCDPASLAGAR